MPQSTYEQQAIELASANGIPTPIDKQPLDFLNKVWGAIPPKELVGLAIEREYYSKDRKQWLPTLSTDGLFCFKEELDQFDFEGVRKENERTDYHLKDRGGVYWQLASRKLSVLEGFNRRGNLDELVSISSFCCDIDCAKVGITLDRAVKALLDLKFPPSLIWFSGGGIQAALVLSEAWNLQYSTAITEYKAYAKAIYADLAGLGVDVDTSVFEAARVLRLPGYINKKPSREGARALLIVD